MYCEFVLSFADFRVGEQNAHYALIGSNGSSTYKPSQTGKLYGVIVLSLYSTKQSRVFVNTKSRVLTTL